MDFLSQFLLMVLGFAMLVKGADWFVDGASALAAKYGISQLVIGLTIVAMGTSAPEAAVSIAAALKGTADITIGNIVGSNILNVLLILGLSAVITTLAVASSTIRVELPYLLAATTLLLGLGYTGNIIDRYEGAALWMAFIAYLAYLFMSAKQQQTPVEAAANGQSAWRLAAKVLVGLAVIIGGSDVSVDAAVKIAAALGMSERLIGLTIVALGTSLPELFASGIAAFRGQADIAIGNIVGSNIFNILFVVGTAAIITPVEFAPNFVLDTSIAIGSAALLLLYVAWQKKLTRLSGLVMLALYAAYCVYLLAA